MEHMHTEQADRSINRGCPACGGAMEFDPAIGKLHCPYCDSVVDIETEGDVTEHDFHAAEHREGFTWGEQQKQLICQSCGAQTIYDALETSAACPFCGSNQVMEESVDTSIPPSGVCLFRITREQADQRFRSWIKKRIFVPSRAKKSASPDNFNGMYLPYWTFDSATVTAYRGEYGIARTVRDGKGNTKTVVNWYPFRGVIDLFIDDELVTGTSRHDATLLRRVEPYNTHDSLPYEPEFMTGYCSERYSVGLEDAFQSAKKNMRSRIENEIISRERIAHGTNRVRLKHSSTTFRDVTYKYMLLPLWESKFTYKNKEYPFLVNGQSGKVGGKAPISPLRVLIAVAIGLALLLGLVFLFSNAEMDMFYSMAIPTADLSQKEPVLLLQSGTPPDCTNSSAIQPISPAAP